jgi:uncharacterized protein
MIPDLLSAEEQIILLKLARQALEKGVRGEPLPPLDLQMLPAQLREIGATFVTLTKDGELRGCIGALDACQPLAEDVREHAIAAALHDYRFPHVSPDELAHIIIEVSRLTPPKPLKYSQPDELPKYLHPSVDGVVLKEDFRRATFLPQVWEKIPDPELFLNYLCQKMGAPPDLWRRKMLEVWTYRVEEFHE